MLLNLQVIAIFAQIFDERGIIQFTDILLYLSCIVIIVSVKHKN